MPAPCLRLCRNRERKLPGSRIYFIGGQQALPCNRDQTGRLPAPEYSKLTSDNQVFLPIFFASLASDCFSDTSTITNPTYHIVEFGEYGRQTAIDQILDNFNSFACVDLASTSHHGVSIYGSLAI
jgi:hypothetical protein